MTTTVCDTDKNLDAACASVAGEIGRTDGKASLLLAFNGAVLAGLASVADNPYSWLRAAEDGTSSCRSAPKRPLFLAASLAAPGPATTDETRRRTPVWRPTCALTP
ncbi:hypothetical protein ACWC0C_41245 [Streptomyces sp. NPDC001709]